MEHRFFSGTHASLSACDCRAVGVNPTLLTSMRATMGAVSLLGVASIVASFPIQACNSNTRTILNSDGLASSSTSVVATAAPSTRPKPMATSIVQLLGNPDRFHGSSVAISGYLAVDNRRGEWGYDGALYLYREDALRASDNFVPLSFSRCSDGDKPSISLDEATDHKLRYVIVYGKFAVHLTDSRVPGVVCSITRIADMQEVPESEAKEAEQRAKRSSNAKRPASAQKSPVSGQ
jgi:hypothetical protein